MAMQGRSVQGGYGVKPPPSFAYFCSMGSAPPMHYDPRAKKIEKVLLVMTVSVLRSLYVESMTGTVHVCWKRMVATGRLCVSEITRACALHSYPLPEVSRVCDVAQASTVPDAFCAQRDM